MMMDFIKPESQGIMSDILTEQSQGQTEDGVSSILCSLFSDLISAVIITEKYYIVPGAVSNNVKQYVPMSQGDSSNFSDCQSDLTK